MGKKDKIKRLKDQAIANLHLVEIEYKQIVKKSSQEPDSFNWGELLNDAELKGLYKVRKDRKYASLTVELYAIIEQLLKDIYHTFYDNQYVQTPEVNIILDLEEKLGHRVNFKNNTKTLADLRSIIIHEDFSLKKARKSANIDTNNRNLFKQLLKDAESYIKNIEITS
ncbi:nucleoside-diphosphate sugar epimerase [Ureibacillus aquaedulcis]|uniref:Nucleoside-diphosphate sugar epimerase n=1 Tax=Ureibacillus aquaedulcis TaxID=3058421 RepID=A0ABT8GTV4_9BACL|nr:nucleoside-diphosphate sugar epimerase [Ureibacillus sp. BA0131]MDN4494321.1 nucleoside-diphosphate sugar epimerase [Ureibacillus sp. BA0131]